MEENNKLSVSALIGLIVGIIALLLSAVPIINNFAAVLAVVGIILGIMGVLKVKKKKRTGKKIAISALSISVLALVVVFASQAMYGAAIDEVSKSVDKEMSKVTGDSTDELLKNDVSVEMGQFVATADEYGLTESALPVTVTNKNAESKSYSIQIEAVDSEGKRIADDYVYANDLGAGQTQEFKVFQFVESEKLEAIKTAEFKIVQVSQM